MQLTLAFVALLAVPISADINLRGIHVSSRVASMMHLSSGGGFGGLLGHRHHGGILGALLGEKRDKTSEAQDQLSGIMQAAQQRLSVAEKQHEKVIAKTRKEAEAVLQKQGLAAGQAVRQYAEDLQAASTTLGKTVDAAKQAIANSEAAEAHLINTWNSPGMEKRARLSAIVTVADREVQKAVRWHKQTVESAQEQAASPFEDDTTQLGRKLGDLTPLIDQAKAALTQEAQKALVAPAAVAKKDNSTAKNMSVANATSAVEKAEVALKQARIENKNATKAAEKRFNAALAQIEKGFKAEVDKMVKEVDVAQQKEIEKVRGPAIALPKINKAGEKAAVAKKPAATSATKHAQVKLVAKTVTKSPAKATKK